MPAEWPHILAGWITPEIALHNWRERIARVAERHPGLKLICTHLGGWKAWDSVERHLIGRDVYFETSFSIAFLGHGRAADMIRRHGTGQVLFGTDWPWNAHRDGVTGINDLDLTEDQKRAILGGNAAELLGQADV